MVGYYNFDVRLFIVILRRSVKSGSLMLPKYLRHSHRYCLRPLSDTENRSRRQQRPCQSLPRACLRSRTRVNFAGVPAAQTDIISVVGNFSSHIGTVSHAVSAAISQVARRHIREPGFLSKVALKGETRKDNN